MACAALAILSSIWIEEVWLLALVFSLCLIASRDGITEVIPDLWASAGTIAHMLGASDWPFG